jgi:two-component system sensor histidine kinase KdpD
MSRATFKAITDRIEVGLERVLAYEKLRRAEEIRRNQELKTALLDSLAHEIKTPLSVITASASSLQSKELGAASRDELTSIICLEADRLNASISEIFWTALVAAGTLKLGKDHHDVRSLIEEAVRDLKPILGKRPITIEAPDSQLPASCDSSMIKGVLKELLTNATKYSSADSPLAVLVQRNDAEIVTSLLDRGIGVQPEDEQRIFEKHYRGTVGCA